MQQDVQTDATCNIQQCWELLAYNGLSNCTGLCKCLATCKWMQRLPTFMPNNDDGSCCVRLHVAKSLTGFKLCATTPNNAQQHVQKDAKCNIQQCWKLLANIVASVCTWLYSLLCKATSCFDK